MMVLRIKVPQLGASVSDGEMPVNLDKLAVMLVLRSGDFSEHSNYRHVSI
jgi:hypothetical protein